MRFTFLFLSPMLLLPLLGLSSAHAGNFVSLKPGSEARIEANDFTTVRCEGNSAIDHRHDLFCSKEDDGSSYKLLQISSGKKLGGRIDKDLCFRLLRNATYNLVCVVEYISWNNPRFYPYRIQDASKIGGGVSEAECLEEIGSIKPRI